MNPTRKKSLSHPYICSQYAAAFPVALFALPDRDFELCAHRLEWPAYSRSYHQLVKSVKLEEQSDQWCVKELQSNGSWFRFVTPCCRLKLAFPAIVVKVHFRAPFLDTLFDFFFTFIILYLKSKLTSHVFKIFLPCHLHLRDLTFMILSFLLFYTK